MIPAGFDYRRASSVDEAIELLSQNGDEAKLLAGGHSLLPLMKLRLATPSMLIDIGRVEDMTYISEEGGDLESGGRGGGGDASIRIGALTRHHDVANSELVRQQVPLLAEVAGQIGDPQVRHRGTIGGSIAHGDPASDVPAALLALRATLISQGPDGRRAIPVDDFFTGFLETALGPDEVLTEIQVPATNGAAWAFQKFQRRAQDWAIVAAALVVRDGRPGVGLVNMGSTPLRAAGVEDELRSGASADTAAARADEGTEPPDDLNASPEFRRHLARVLVRRGLESAGV